MHGRRVITPRMPPAAGAPALRPIVVCAVLLLAVGFASPDSGDFKETFRFAADMSVRGNWREARYRLEQLQRAHPDNHKVLNNLAVTAEVLGEGAEARELYARAAVLSGGDADVEDNRRRFEYFWQQNHPDEPVIEPPVVSGGTSTTGGKKGKTVRVQVGLPVPARLKLEGDETLLVTSFRTRDTNMLDTNRELVRYLRSEFRKHTDLNVLPIVPPPPIPEQSVADLLANDEFWKHLHRNYDADLIVTGIIYYDREDVSSFQDVDVVSGRTGQKVRETRFVEQEQFFYEVEIFFIEGKTGELLFRDRLERSVIYRGLSNDPIGAFYSMSDAIAGDVLAVVSSRIREDTRIIFKK